MCSSDSSRPYWYSLSPSSAVSPPEVQPSRRLLTAPSYRLNCLFPLQHFQPVLPRRRNLLSRANTNCWINFLCSVAQKLTATVLKNTTTKPSCTQSAAGSGRLFHVFIAVGCFCGGLETGQQRRSQRNLFPLNGCRRRGGVERLEWRGHHAVRRVLQLLCGPWSCRVLRPPALRNTHSLTDTFDCD